MAVAPEGQPLVAVLALLGIVVLLLAPWAGRFGIWLAGYLLVLLALGTAFHFRDPDRVGARGPDVFLAPSDGRVVDVRAVEEPGYLHGPAQRISVAAGPLDVQVQRSPAEGVVDYVQRSGAAGREVAIGISTGELRIMIRHAASLVARRVVLYVEEGELVDQGGRMGVTRLGARVEVFLPSDAEVLVRPGDRVHAGATVLATYRPTREAP